MATATHSLNYELPHDLHFNKYAQQILENSKTGSAASTPTITTFDASTVSSDFLQKLSASILNSIQLQNFQKSIDNTAGTTTTANSMELDFAPNNVAIVDASSSFDAMDELQKQLEYDKFMNEVWIGIVMTLILISMVFCICSCFLYHQFRTWKRNYHNSENQAQNLDIEALKYQPDISDPVPEYTLVSGLPTYEAALELLHKTPKSCLIVYPSVFSVFNKNERVNNEFTAATMTAQQQQNVEVTTPLLTTTTSTTQIDNQSSVKTVTSNNNAPIPTYAEAISTSTLTCQQVNEKKSTTTIAAAAIPVTTTTTDITLEKAPSYEQAALLVKTDKRH